MKLKKRASICAKQKVYILCDKTESGGQLVQWLSDGCAAYPLNGLPPLEEESLCKIFEISEKRRDNVVIQQIPIPEGIATDDIDQYEVLAEKMEPWLLHDGKELIPLLVREGVIFIQSMYLSPLEDESELLELYERKTRDGRTYIAAKAGFMLRAVIFPVDVINENFVKHLGNLIRECQRALYKKGTKDEAGPDNF